MGHISRDATAIAAREKPAPKAAKPKKARRRGRPRKGEERATEPSRLERQLTMTLPQMLEDLPKSCDIGMKKNAKGAGREVDRLQTAHRHGRWRDPHQLGADLGVDA